MHTRRLSIINHSWLSVVILLQFILPSLAKTELRFIGETPVASKYKSFVFDEERQLFYGADGYGLVVIDISDPWRPVVACHVPTPGMSEYVAFEGELVYLTDNGGVRGQNGVSVINLEDPFNPEYLGYWQPPERGDRDRRGRTFDVAAREGLFYVTHGLESPGQPDVRVNLSTFRPFPDRPPNLLTTVEVPASTRILPVGNFLYMSATFSMILVDIANREEPEYVDSFNGMWWKLLRFNDYVISGGPFSAITIYDVSNPAEPEDVEFYNADTSVYNISISRDLLAVERRTTLRLYGLWDIPNLEPLFDGDEQDDPQLWAADALALGNGIMVTGHDCNGLRFFDLLDPFEPEQYEHFPQSPQATEIHIGQDILVALSFDTDRLTTFRLEDDGSPVQVGEITIPRAEEIIVRGNYAYALCQREGLMIVDLSEPVEPRIIGEWSDPDGRGRIYGAAVSEDGGTLYGCTREGDSRYLSTFNVSDPENPRFAHDFYEDHLYTSIRVAGNHLYATQDDRYAAFDITEPDDPRLLIDIDIPCGRKFFVAGDYMFAARYTPQALRILDISDVDDPELVFNREDTLRIYTQGLSAHDSLLIQFNRDWGMIVWDITNPEQPDSIAWIDTPGKAYGGCWIGDNLYVADYTSVRHYNTGIEDNIETPTSPASFTFYQPFPNPFNNSTILRYSLDHNCDICLSIYDVTGREVTVIEKGYRPAGEHQVEWYASDTSAGIYFAVFSTVENREIRKLILLR